LVQQSLPFVVAAVAAAASFSSPTDRVPWVAEAAAVAVVVVAATISDRASCFRLASRAVVPRSLASRRSLQSRWRTATVVVVAAATFSPSGFRSGAMVVTTVPVTPVATVTVEAVAVAAFFDGCACASCACRCRRDSVRPPPPPLARRR